jgi:hypothetical protein
VKALVCVGFRGSSSERLHQSAPGGAKGGQRRTKKRPGKNDPAAIPGLSRCPQNRSDERHLHRSQDLPYCTFALLTHVSFAGLASASHFSIATL